MEIKDSIEIKTKPEKIWEFFTNLEENYKTWHPQDHVLFKWTGGKPMEVGSTFYGEEVMRGELKKLKGTCVESIPNRKVVFKLPFPISLVTSKIEWIIEPKGSNSVFTAIIDLRFERFYRKLFKKRIETAIEVAEKHMGEEGENLKKILEE